MTLLRLCRAAAAGLAVSVLLWATAAGHPSDSGIANPTTFPAVVRVIRDEMRSAEQANQNRDYDDVKLHATLVAGFAAGMPPFVLGLSGALEDSAVGRILRAGVRVRESADAILGAAERRDSLAIVAQVARFADVYAFLDTYVPKQYVCPMHCETSKLYDRPGSCPVCQMHLQLVTSDRYSVEVTPARAPIRARSPVWLDFQIKDPAGFEVESLLVVHEQPLHLMIVSHDLSRFDHVHPTLGARGRFRLRHTFPIAGKYVLYHDFTPDSVGMQVVPVEVAVEGAPPPRVPLVVDDDRPKKVDGYEVTLTHSTLAPAVDCSMTFSLTRGGKPVTDLEPFLGASGHLVMISEDRAAYVHSHPLEKDASRGPSIQFNMKFARTGLYKAWGQFQRKGKVVTVPFVIRVAADDRDPELTQAGERISR